MSAPNQSYVRVERPDPIVRADSVAHVAFERRDVESMSRFLVNLGLIAHETRDGIRYFRGWIAEVYGRGATTCRTLCVRSSPFAYFGPCWRSVVEARLI